jgi:starvation-inducible outer membrane lipoprotein
MDTSPDRGVGGKRPDMERNVKKSALISAVAAAAAILSACSSSPEIEASTPKTVIVKKVSSKQSEKECQKFGKHAVIINYNKSEKTATYECKDA